MHERSVVIVGAGPTGMMLAAELTLGGVEVEILERRPTPELPGVRAGGLHSRSIEVLDQRGIAERFLSQGKTMQLANFGTHPIDMSDFPTRHPYGLALTQNHIERILGEWITELGVHVRRGIEVTDLKQDDEGVTVTFANGESTRAKFLVGCDGGRSVIRKKAGIDFPGWDASVSYILAEGELAQEPVLGFRPGDRGTNAIGKLEDGNRVRIVLVEPKVEQASDAPTLEELKSALIAVYGSDFGVHNVTWLSRFSDAARQAATYRKGRVLVAGDAAHTHSPVGGQGLNTGLQDAVNLGWKLARVVKGTSAASVLDTYHSERHPVGARVLKLTLAQTALARGDTRTEFLREQVGELLKAPETRKRYAAMMTGLDLHYAQPDAAHPLIGRRMPDLELAGGKRVFSYLHDAQPVLLNFSGESLQLTTSVPVVDAHFDGTWELPAIGAVPAPKAVLIRPDGHVAWAGSPGDPKLADALRTWFARAD
ncbi:MAG: FAD-dependent monooxygenase [Archangium sp.]|nr:FAD-dependent monooxygenase [Archangium sp.]